MGIDVDPSHFKVTTETWKTGTTDNDQNSDEAISFDYQTARCIVVLLIAQLVRALHRYRRGQGSNPGKPDFFRLSFRNGISCVNNCEDLLYIYFFIPQFKYMSFIYS